MQTWPQDVRNHPKWQDAGNKVGAVLLAALRNLSGFKDSQQQTEAILRVAACLSCLAPCCVESYPVVPVLPLGVVNDLKAALGAAQQPKPSPKVALTLSAKCTVHWKAMVMKLEVVGVLRWSDKPWSNAFATSWPAGLGAAFGSSNTGWIHASAT